MKINRFLLILILIPAVQIFNPSLLMAQQCQLPDFRNVGASCSNPNPPPNPPPPPPPPPITGLVEPKYVVLAVTYAPPGAASTVQYANSTMLGTSTSLMSSFTKGTTQSVTITTGFQLKIGNLFSIGSQDKQTTTTSYTQEQDTSSSIAVNQTTSVSTTVRGPSSSAVGLSHDADIIWVWLNPVLTFSIFSPTDIQWNGYSFDLSDPVGDMDILGIPVAYLNGHAAIPSDIAAILARRWASPTWSDSGGPGLTQADFAAILAADPFSNPSYTINIPTGSTCTADGRFCLAGNQNFQYEPPPPGEQPTTQTFTVTHQTTATEGQGATDTRTVSYSTDVSFNVSVGNNTAEQAQDSPAFTATFGADLTNGNSLSWTNKFNTQSTQQVGQTATLTITGPAASDNYTGPVEFNIYQDNVYGSFMFGFIPAPTFSVSDPSPMNILLGTCSSETVSIGALVSGFNSTVVLSVTGLPSGVTASFNPTSVTGAGSSTLTICAASSATTGNYSFVVGGTSGSETHSNTVTFSLTDYAVSMSPSSQTTTPGGSVAYTATISAINSFSGNVALSVSGLPSGASASFSPNSIAGSGSATMNVTTSSSTPTGNYTLTVVGSSQGVSRTAPVTLTVSTTPPPPPGGGGGGGGCAIVPGSPGGKLTGTITQCR